MRTYATYNIKGGVGKTTTAVSGPADPDYPVGAHPARCGLRSARRVIRQPARISGMSPPAEAVIVSET